MDWVLIITLALTGAPAGGKFATIQTVEFSSEQACESAKEAYLATNKNEDDLKATAVCVSKGLVISKIR